MNLFMLLIGCVPCCAPEPFEVVPVKEPSPEKDLEKPKRCDNDLDRDCYIAPVAALPRYRK